MRHFITHVNNEELVSRFNRSNLSFKYFIVSIEDGATEKGEPAKYMVLSPTGYNDRKCFRNGEFDQSKISKTQQFMVEITDFEVESEKLTDTQKYELQKMMFENKKFTQTYVRMYKKYHSKKIDKEFLPKLELAEKLRSFFVRRKGEKWFKQYLSSIQQEYQDKKLNLELAFTQAESARQ